MARGYGGIMQIPSLATERKIWRVSEGASERVMIFTLFCSRLASRFLWVRKWSLAVPLAAG